MVYRGVRGGVSDRWFKKVKQDDGSTIEVPAKDHGVTKRWKARIVDSESTERAKVFEVKKEADAWVREQLAAVHAGVYVDPKRGRITVGDVYEVWSEGQGHLAKKTKQTRTTAWNVHVSPRWASVPIGDVRTPAVRSWVTGMVKDGIGVATIENSFRLLSNIVGAAVEEGRLAKNTCEGVKLPKRLHADRGYLTHGQVLALAANCERDGLVVEFLSYTGLRWGEMAALRVQDFDMLRRRVSVHRNVVEVNGLDWRTPKTWERRSVRFPADVSERLAAAMEGKPRGDLVFQDLRGGVLRNSNWRSRVFAPALVKCQKSDADMPTITPRDLRHTAASLAVSAGANVLGVQRMLGHKNAAMTLNTYADLFDADLEAVADALDLGIRAARAAAAERVRNPVP